MIVQMSIDVHSSYEIPKIKVYFGVLFYKSRHHQIWWDHIQTEMRYDTDNIEIGQARAIHLFGV